MLTKADIYVDIDADFLYRADGSVSFMLIDTNALNARAEEVFGFSLQDEDHQDGYFDFYLDISNKGEVEELYIVYLEWGIKGTNYVTFSDDEAKEVLKGLRLSLNTYHEDLDKILEENIGGAKYD